MGVAGCAFAELTVAVNAAQGGEDCTHRYPPLFPNPTSAGTPSYRVGERDAALSNGHCVLRFPMWGTLPGCGVCEDTCVDVVLASVTHTSVDLNALGAHLIF